MKTVVIAGKNDIAVNILSHMKMHFEDAALLSIMDKGDTGINSWQRSLRFYCERFSVPIVTLEEVYDIPDLIFISVEFDQIIKPERFRSSSLFNIHFSLLPKYKGLYTSVLPILNGDDVTGVTLHRMRSGIDTGEIIDQEAVAIPRDINSRQLYGRLTDAGTEVVIRNMSRLIEGTYGTKPQSAVGSSYYGKGYIDYKNLYLNLNCTAYQIQNQIRAFAFRPYQLIKFQGVGVIGGTIMNTPSQVKPGTVISEDEISWTVAAIDYEIILFKDVLEELFTAIQNGDNEKAMRMCGFRPIINDKDVHGWTALTAAVYNGNLEFAKWLVRHGADKKTVNNNGTTLLMYAKDAGLRLGNWDVFRWLTALGLSVYEKDYEEKSLMDYLTIEQIYSLPDDIASILSVNMFSAKTKDVPKSAWGGVLRTLRIKKILITYFTFQNFVRWYIGKNNNPMTYKLLCKLRM